MSATGSHIVTAEQLSRAEPGLRRLVGLLLWLFSLAGNVLAFGGGWDDLGWNRALAVAIGVSLLYQAICTAVQLVTCRHWWNPLYLVALGASVVPSFIGYWPVIALPLIRGATGLSTALTLALLPDLSASSIIWIIIICLAVLIGLIAVDVIPERVFVRH